MKKIIIGILVVLVVLICGGAFLHLKNKETKPLESSSSAEEKKQKLEKPDEDRVLQHADFEIIDNYDIYPTDQDKETLQKNVDTILNSFDGTLFNINDQTADYSDTLKSFYGTGELFENSDIDLTANMYKEFKGLHMQSELKSVEIAHILVRDDKETKEISVSGAIHIKAKNDRMEEDEYAIPFNSVMNMVDGQYKFFTMSYSDVYKEKGFAMARMDDGSYNIALKGEKIISFDFQNVDDFINQTEAPAGHSFNEADYDEVK